MSNINISQSKIIARLGFALGGLLLLMIAVAASGLSGLESVSALSQPLRSRQALAVSQPKGAGAIEPAANGKGQAETTNARVEQVVSQARVLLVGLTLVSLAFGVLMLWWATRSSMRSLAAALEAAPANKVGAPPCAEESRHALAGLRRVNDQLVNLVGEKPPSSDSVTAEPPRNVPGDSQRAEAQASAVKQATTMIDELNQTARQHAATVQQATKLASRTWAAAAQGSSVVTELASTMEGLLVSSRHIGDILGEIDGLEFRDNLLSLGRAVETARHSDVRGDFAVVAGEVIQLALRSATVAREIKAAIDTALTGIENSQRLVTHANRSLSSVISHARGVDGLIGEIADTCIEQTSGITQLAQAVRELEQLSRQEAPSLGLSSEGTRILEQQALNSAGRMNGFPGSADHSPVPAMAEMTTNQRSASSHR